MVPLTQKAQTYEAIMNRLLALFFFAFSFSAFADESKEAIGKWCGAVSEEVKKLNWKIDPCLKDDWKIWGQSELKNSLIYGEFGNLESENVTLVLSMVHSDEITPLYIGLRLVQELIENKELTKGAKIVVAPLVNVDRFLQKTKLRTNANKVDLNRNFDTKDWNESAHKLWKTKMASNARRFPGHKSASEQGTLFQKWLIEHFKPKKILSIHAPLNNMDYDGPNSVALSGFSKDYVSRCLELRSQVKAKSTGYFPGSLGNYAGHERGIPTITLELPTTNPAHGEKYWKQFTPGITRLIEFDLGQKK